MKRQWKSLLLGACGMAIAGTAIGGGPLTSEYTELTKPQCKEIQAEKQFEEDDSFSMMCPGIGGYKLQIISADARYSINMLDPSGKEHELDFWNPNVITGRLSSLGENAEWLSEKKGVPIALIVRVNAMEEDPKKPYEFKRTSYLAVAKITRNEICVTDKIAPSPKMNEAARLAAQSAATKPCRK